MMRAYLGHGLLGGIFIAFAAAACGGGGGEGPGPQTPSATPSGSQTPPTGPGAASNTPASSGAPAGTTVAPPPAAKGEMKAPVSSAMLADLTGLGLDPKKLPPLSKLDPDKLRQVMKTFTKSLGVGCSGCHDANDFKASTPKKKVASKMWDAFVRGLTMEDGSPLYCDSCHAGHMEFLDTTDKKALGKWMDANYVSKLKRVDKKDHGCETCHGDPFEPKFLTAWAK